MKIIKNLFELYITGSLHVAFAVFSFTYLTYVQLNIPPSYQVLGIVYASTVLGYNFVKNFGFSSFIYGGKKKWGLELLILSSVALLIGVYLFFDLKVISRVLLVVLGILTFLYAMPLSWPKSFLGKTYILREINGVKVFIIAVVWSLTTVLLPILSANMPVQIDLIIVLVQRYLWVLVLMVPFEIRDLKYDSPSMGTLPQQLGTRGVKCFGALMLLIILLLECSKEYTNSCFLVIEIAMALMMLVLLYRSHEHQHEWYSSFFVEGIPIAWLLFSLMFC